jgi:glyoxylase-like metal-dependent hydrolase (beta-lactamase superfamily II)
MRAIWCLVACLAIGVGCDDGESSGAVDMGQGAGGEGGAGGADDDPEITTSQRENGSAVAVYDHGAVRIHAYTTPEDFAGNGLYLIESENGIVAIDTGFGTPISADYNAYIAAIGKPVSRVIITHDHPDHWMNLGDSFADVPAYSTAGTIAALEEAGRPTFDGFGAQLGPVAPVEFRIPDQVLPDGGETIDGIEYTYEVVYEAEAAEQVIIRLPAFDTIFVGDIVYSGYHLALTGYFDGWRTALENLADDPATYVMPGHGAPTDPSIYAWVDEYLAVSKELYEENTDDPDAFLEALGAAYPDALGAGLFFGVSRGYLYPEE